jgi:ATP-dependent DNA ligase
MSPPEPMLSCSARRWPQGGEWVLQPKWDGFRLLVEVGADRRVRGWSRHGTNLTARLGGLTAAFADAPALSVFDGELVAISEQGGRPVQDFAAVCRAVLRGDTSAAEDLRFVGFDLLALGGEDLRGRPWSERDLRLTEALPASGLIGRAESLPASPAAHAAILALGFEGTVLKRPKSTYRPGRQRVWLKHKARCTSEGMLLSVHRDRHGQWHGVCDVDGRRVSVLAGARSADQIGEVVTLVYSRVDADGGLREVRIAGPRTLLRSPLDRCVASQSVSD